MSNLNEAKMLEEQKRKLEQEVNRQVFITAKPITKKRTKKTAMEHFLDSYKENEELYKLLAE